MIGEVKMHIIFLTIWKWINWKDNHNFKFLKFIFDYKELSQIQTNKICFKSKSKNWRRPNINAATFFGTKLFGKSWQHESGSDTSGKNLDQLKLQYTTTWNLSTLHPLTLESRFVINWVSDNYIKIINNSIRTMANI